MAPTMTAASTQNLETATWRSTLSLTVTFTPAIGDILVIKVVTEDAAGAVPVTPTVTGGGNPAVTLRASDATASHCGVYLWTTAAVTAATSTTVACAKTNSTGADAMIVVERWASATLAATPATNATKTGTGAPSTTLTSVANSSAVTWCSGDWAAVTGSPAYLSSAVQTGTRAGDASVYGAYVAYQAAATAGSQTMGLSAPTGETWNLVGIEVEGTGGTDATVTMGSALAAATAQPVPQPGSLSGPAYAGSAADLGGGTGSWTNPGNADGAPDSTYATWAVV